jgi:hypothetical protein
MLPLIVQLTPEIKLTNISYDSWDRIKDKVEFVRLLKGETNIVSNKHIILAEGRMIVEEK